MIGAVGTDSIEIERIQRAVDRWGERFLNRVFQPEEIDYCRSRPRPYQHYGARFAAKEACMKCLGRGVWGGMGFREIETVRDEEGRPGLVLHGYAGEVFERSGATHLHLSLTHTETIATALVVMETRETGRPGKCLE
jgi:holo-[acyl-carrier protein] synthase